MTTAQKFADIKAMTIGPRRREAVRRYLAAHPGIRARVAERTSVDVSMISKMLHGASSSARVEQAFAIEEKVKAKLAA